LTEFDGKLYFTADDGVHGNELFVSDGTAEGTQLVKDIYPGEFQSSTYDYGSQFDDFYTRNLLEFDGKLYFAANDGEHGEELFVSDGTAEGTQLVKDIYPGENQYGYKNSSAPSNLVEFKDKFYFAANDGVHGNELFVSDGTAEGTQLVADLREETDGNSYGSSPSDLVEFNDKLYFAAYDGESTDLYVSDGTAEGTQLLYPGKDQDGNGYVWDPDNLVEFNDKLYFTANDGEHGIELFVSDGTAEGTQLVADLNPGAGGSYASKLTVVGDELFFSANSSENEANFELFKLTLDDSTDETTVSINISNDSDSLFVLSFDDGSETIADFDLGSDRLGLADGLQFDDLSFVGNNILAGEEVLVTLDGINTEQLTCSDFETI
jgi:ELWxxDGT repeat protein